MTTDTTKPLAKFSWSLNSNTGLSSSGHQDDITPEMYGAIMGVLAGRFPEAEIGRLQAHVDGLRSGLDVWADTAGRAQKHAAELQAQVDALAGALQAIRQYGSDTLSGRTDGPDDRAWQRAAVREMTKRASAALAAAGR